MSTDERIVVGVGRIVLGLHGNDSLKGKRGVLNQLKAKVANHFNVSIAEVGGQDYHERAIIAVALVSNDTGYVQATLEKVVRFIENLGTVEVLADDVAVENYGGGFAGRE